MVIRSHRNLAKVRQHTPLVRLGAVQDTHSIKDLSEGLSTDSDHVGVAI